MQFSKVAISLLLLLTYSFGSVHDLIPHYQGLDLQNSIPITHNHHQHSQEDIGDSGHNHFLHNNHFDKDLLDLIVCFFSETEHAKDGCNIQPYLPIGTIDVSTKELTKVKLVTILFVIFLKTDQNELNSIFKAALKVKYFSPLLEDSPYRGPPSIS